MNTLRLHSTRYFLPCLCMFLLCACVADSKQYILATEKTQVETRSIQTRTFDTDDKLMTVRTVLSTLQDLGFVIDQADETLGTISATKLDEYVMRMTVTVRQRGDDQMQIRANAQYNLEEVADAKPYQNFFNALEQAMFLNLHQVH